MLEPTECRNEWVSHTKPGPGHWNCSFASICELSFKSLFVLAEFSMCLADAVWEVKLDITSIIPGSHDEFIVNKISCQYYIIVPFKNGNFDETVFYLEV